MKNKIKIKCIVCLILIVFGIAITILSLKLNGLSEIQKSYINGFGTSISVLSVVLLIKNLSSLKTNESLRKREIELTDERSIEIYTKSLAITFRICILLEALASFILVCMNDKMGINIGLLISMQLIVFIISNVIISRKI